MNILQIFSSFIYGFFVGILCTKLSFWIYAFHKEFFWSLLAQILGGGVVAICSFWFLSKYSTLLSKPKLKLVVKQFGTYSNTINFKRNGTNFDAEFDLGILNTGNKSLVENQGFWHFYIVGGTVSCSHTGALDLVDGNHMRNIISFPILPQNALDLNLHLKITFQEDLKDNIKTYAFLTTEFGAFPKKALMNGLGLVEFKNMQNITINYL